MRSLLQTSKRAIGRWKRGARVCDENEPFLPASDEVQRRNSGGGRLSSLHKISRLPLSLFACTSRDCLGGRSGGEEVMALERGGQAWSAADINHVAVGDHMRYTMFM